MASVSVQYRFRCPTKMMNNDINTFFRGMGLTYIEIQTNKTMGQDLQAYYLRHAHFFQPDDVDNNFIGSREVGPACAGV
jgi:hypothetical protein